MTYIMRLASVSGLLMIATLLACGDDSPSAPTATREMTTLVPASPVTSDGVVGTTVPGPKVRVLDSLKRPMRGITVNFTVSVGDGSIENTSVTTQDDGIAAAGLLTLGTRAQTHIVRATSDFRSQLLFYVNVRPDAPVALKLSWEGSQVGFPGSAVRPPIVHVVDIYGNGVPNVLVSFAGTNGRNSERPIVIKSDQAGFAFPESWMLGPTSGTYVVTASASGLTPVTITAIAVEPSDVIAIYDTIDSWPAQSAWIALTSGGQFIEETQWSDGPSPNSGTYTLQDSTLTLRYFWGGEETATLQQNSLVRYPFTDDFDSPVRWTYKKRGS